ncbi:MAG: radical SAM protein [Candidatus Bathyarchaeota archaeon]|nr:radical SAM protein [Candidatus Bathyarchaeota archaeon]
MNDKLTVLVLNLPSPPNFDVCREWAGGFGTATPVRRRLDYGQSSKPILYPFLPYSCAVLSNEHYDYNVLDCQRLKLNRVETLGYVKKLNPDVIISLIALPSLRPDLKLLDMIKVSLPFTKIVGVGTSCRFLQNDILLNSKIDAVLRSDYPYISNLAEFLKTLKLKKDLKEVSGISYFKDGKVVNTAENPVIILDKLPAPKYDDLDLNGYDSFKDSDGNRYNYVPIIGSKGCPYSCIYCPYSLGWGKKCTYRSPTEIIDEIEQLCKRGIKGFLFRDQSFLMNKTHATKVCKEILKRKLNIAWFCEARVDHTSKPLLELMKKAGCKQIHFGLETGDPGLIKLGKPKTDLSATRKAFRLAKETGLLTTAHVILGWPDETLETLARTSKFIGEIAPDYVNWNFLTPYPGTKLDEIARKHNLILTRDWSKYTSHTVVMKMKWLTIGQFHKAVRNIILCYSKQQLLKILKSAIKRPCFAFDELINIVNGYLK